MVLKQFEIILSVKLFTNCFTWWIARARRNLHYRWLYRFCAERRIFLSFGVLWHEAYRCGMALDSGVAGMRRQLEWTTCVKFTVIFTSKVQHPTKETAKWFEAEQRIDYSLATGDLSLISSAPSAILTISELSRISTTLPSPVIAAPLNRSKSDVRRLIRFTTTFWMPMILST